MHSVTWSDAALAELATIWNSASPGDDALLTWAISDIIYELQRDPENVGESRPQNRRVMFSYPLGVLFDVVGGDVWIYSVWRRA
jgi:hypothetical protein